MMICNVTEIEIGMREGRYKYSTFALLFASQSVFSLCSFLLISKTFSAGSAAQRF